MTHDHALIRDQRISGVQHGQAIARIVIKQFPMGFTTEVGDQLRQITDGALAHVIDKLTASGVAARYRMPFAAGFKEGLRKAYGEYADSLVSRIKQVV
jgi:hypothetical protein